MKTTFTILMALILVQFGFSQSMVVNKNDGSKATFPLTDIKNITFEVLPTAGLVAYYPFNGNANDESGNKYNGTNQGATLTKDRFGNVNSAFYFNGSSNIEIPNSENLNFSGGGVTLAVWLNFSSDNYDTGLLSKHKWAVGSGWVLNVFVNKLTFYGTGEPRLTTDETYKDGKWHLLVGVFDGTTRYLYLDGNLKKKELGTAIIENNETIKIGSATDGGYFEGSLDDVRIYNRTLTAEEIQLLYKQ